MNMQMRIRHTTGYHYERGAAASFNEARMTPMTTSEQYVLRSRLEITPTPWSYEYRDYWGTTVTSFEVQDPHTDLTVVATATVETQEHPPRPHSASWDDLLTVQDEYCEFLELSSWVAPAPSLLTELEYRPLADIVFDLPVEMERLQRSCAAASDAVTARYVAEYEEHTWSGGVLR